MSSMELQKPHMEVEIMFLSSCWLCVVTEKNLAKVPRLAHLDRQVVREPSPKPKSTCNQLQPFHEDFAENAFAQRPYRVPKSISRKAF
eukprot:3394038-Amphidinium_carterae.1